MASKRDRIIKKKRKKHYALFILIGISTILGTVFGYMMRSSLYASDEMYDPKEEPGIVLVLHGIRNGIYPWNAKAEDFSMAGRTLAKLFSKDEPSSEVPSGTDIITSEIPSEPVSEIPSEIASEIPSEPASEIGDTPSWEDSVKEFVRVDDDYFNDALFIGDSRIVGLADYVEPLYSRADFYVKRAMTIYHIKDGKAVATINGEQKDVWQVLSEKQYGKIYISVGINEIGTGTPEYYGNAFAEVVRRIREAQPDAYIFIISIMHVTTNKSNNDKLYNNPNINARNEVLIPLADQIRTFYIDVNEAVDDEYGGMRADISYDEVHLLGSCNELFHEFLLDHGVQRPEQLSTE